MTKNTSIHRYFGDIDDPRIERTKKYALINIIFIALCAVICGAEDWVSIVRFSRARQEWLSQFLDLSQGLPSHDTFGRVFSLINNEIFAKCFTSWVETLAEKVKKVIAVDGKSMRGTKNNVKGLGALHMVNVWRCENQLVLGQEVVTDKSNEITAIPLLLDLLDISGATITLDAMGCQKEIVKKITDKEADYLLSLKGNQGNLHKDVELYFKSVDDGKLKPKIYQLDELEKAHGRIEKREYFACVLPEGLHSEGWAKLNSIVKVRSTRTIQSQTSIEDRYYISSIVASHIEGIATATRAHWQVENNLHWQLDVSFNEDAWHARQGNAGMNMALINKMALNLLKKENTSKVGMKNRRLLAGWDEHYLEKVLMMGTN